MGGDATGIAYIYALCDPRDGAVRYVGKSVDPEARLRGHIQESRKTDYYRHRRTPEAVANAAEGWRKKRIADRAQEAFE